MNDMVNCAKSRRATRGGIQRLEGVVHIVSAETEAGFEHRGTIRPGTVRFVFDF